MAEAGSGVLSSPNLGKDTIQKFPKSQRERYRRAAEGVSARPAGTHPDGWPGRKGENAN